MLLNLDLPNHIVTMKISKKKSNNVTESKTFPKKFFSTCSCDIPFSSSSVTCLHLLYLS